MNLKASEVCYGKENRNLIKIKNEINEFITFIDLNEELKSFLISCLCIPENKIISMNIDPQKKYADIKVKDQKTAAIAIGTNGNNVRLTKIITGFKINILRKDENDDGENYLIALSPEDELKIKFFQEIPDADKEKIRIINIVREPGIQSKVVVDSVNNEINVLHICKGKNNKILNSLIAFFDESVWFVKWVENREIFLSNCLGISRYGVDRITIDDLHKKALIVLTTKRMVEKAIGKHGINVKQAAKLMNLNNIHICTSKEYSTSSQHATDTSK
ncbi:MAG: hypothetical protein ACTSQ8_21085 [Candidatus Helarchaeota archaeon]